MTRDSTLDLMPDLELDSWLAPYEAAAERGESPDVGDFLPEATHPKYAEVLGELVRVDLEYAWRRGEERFAEEYLDRFPALRSDPVATAGVALEEYRQRRAAGDEPDPDEYRHRLGVDLPGRPARPSDPVPEWLGIRFPEPGEVVPPGYQIVDELGRGSVGRVYLAEQADLANRRLAIKVSPRPLGEAQTLARLQHTHIVPVFAAHRVGGFQVLVMPYLGGTTLADVLAVATGPGQPTKRTDCTAVRSKVGSEPTPVPHVFNPASGSELVPPASAVMPYGRVIELGIAIADALAHAHERGVLHRDVKPANILLTDHGEPMLLDFNLAAIEHLPTETSGGTPRYMAPEQLASFGSSSNTPDARADVYSLGLVLHELFTGRLPFPDPEGNWPEAAPKLLADRRQPPAIRLSSPALASILRTCLAPDPADRYPSAAALRSDLVRHRDHLPLRTAPDPISVERLRKWAHRHPRLSATSTVTAFAILLLSIGAVAWYSAWQSNGKLRAQAAHTEVGRARAQAQTLAFDPAGPAANFREARGTVLAALEPYHLPADENWLNGRNVRRLPASDVYSLREEIADLLFWGAVAIENLASRQTDLATRTALLDEALAWNRRAGEAVPIPGPVASLVSQRTRLLELTGRSAEAATARAELEHATIPGPDGEMWRAQVEIQAGRYCDAIATLERLEATGVSSFAFWLRLGYARLRAHQPDRAADAFVAAAALRPEAAQPHLYRGVALIEMGRCAAALEPLGKYITRRSDDPAGYVNRALARLKIHDPTAALSDLRDAERLNGSPIRIAALRETAWRELGEVGGAAEAHRVLLASQPADADDWTIRGEARLATDPTGALSDFDTALALVPDHISALRGRASSLSERLGRPADAVAALDRIDSLGAATVVDRAGHAVLLARLGRATDARNQARTCLADDTPALPLYQAASALALTARTAADRAQVIAVVRRVVQRDARWAREMSTDPDLASVHQEKEFQELISAARVVAGAEPLK
jgi:serine/threonine protein kinase/predicted Zn-dependent protease